MTYAHAHAHATPIDVSALGNTRVSEDGARLLADYAYRRTLVDTTNTQGQSQHRVREVVTDYRLQTDVRVPRLG